MKRQWLGWRMRTTSTNTFHPETKSSGFEALGLVFAIIVHGALDEVIEGGVTPEPFSVHIRCVAENLWYGVEGAV